MASAVSSRSASQRFYDDLPSANQLMRNIKKVALPAILLLAAVNAPVAKAGPWAYAACLMLCAPLAEAPPLLAICIAACTGITLPAPTP